MTSWRRYIVDERLGLQVLVEPLRWRVEVLTSCPADVRAMMAGSEPWEGTARNEREAIERSLVALGRIQGFVLARRQPIQQHIFAAAHMEHQRDQDWLRLRVGVQAACLAFERDWQHVAAAIMEYTRQVSADRYSLLDTGHRAAASLVDRFAAAMRQRRVPL